MNLLLLHRNTGLQNDQGCGFVRFGLSSKRLGDIVRQGLIEYSSPAGFSAVTALPEDWNAADENEISYNSRLHLDGPGKGFHENEYSVISDGSTIINIDQELLLKAVSVCGADIAAVSIKPELAACNEIFRFAPDDQVAGCRRYYSDAVVPWLTPNDWPDYLFIRKTALKNVFDSELPLDFSEFNAKAECNGLTVKSVHMGGKKLNIDSRPGFLEFVLHIIDKQHGPVYSSTCKIADDAEIIGPVVIGDNVTVQPGAVIVGPAFIGDNATVSKNAVVRSSVIADGITVAPGKYVSGSVITDENLDLNHDTHCSVVGSDFFSDSNNVTEVDWRRFSYPLFFKRIADIVFSAMMLAVFAPFFPIVALALKINSPGPLFYSARRQGLGGREFGCLKFRTMVVDADKLQDKLRCVNQIDGPQFKMDDDPRISKVGKFLRDTCIDEIPQFINVLRGQMSVVGPRPSPESENMLCSSWRDARLSVRPGITGLWQVCRTRDPSRDFQEWIHYDTEYVKNVSLKKDLWICWKTAVHILKSFLKKF